MVGGAVWSCTRCGGQLADLDVPCQYCAQHDYAAALHAKQERITYRVGWAVFIVGLIAIAALTWWSLP